MAAVRWRKKSVTTTESDAYRSAIEQWLLLCDLERDYLHAISNRDWIKAGRISEILHRHRTNCIELSYILLNSAAKGFQTKDIP